MPAIASTIFKIRAHSDFIAPADASPDVLSFRKGQPFYALNADYDKGTYFVSTQFAVPFSRTAVSGLVPMEYFDKVDLLSKDPPMHRKKAAAPTSSSIHKVVVPRPAAPQDTLPPVPVRKQSLSHNPEWKDTISDIITAIEVLSMAQDQFGESFCIKVIRGKMAHIINRSIPEFIALAAAAGEVFSKVNTEHYPLAQSSTEGKINALELYLNRLTLQLLPTVSASQAAKLYKAKDVFFNPKDSEEFVSGQTILRRDSGASTDDAKPSQFDSRTDRVMSKVNINVANSATVKSPRQKSAKNPFATISRMVFGNAAH
ncbi:hypothetical protein HDV03_004505 [Kappamyces sp. JEL0829]|nr:hypothetical protein HDV03_004505 [Kappamyces sp. JEL0829]KAJ3367516.1 hypothetical protein HDU91_001350 [Kappamyces sp. JEL0680]